MIKVNYATRDQDGKIVLYILIKKRKEIPFTTFESYWKNVHGPVSARLPGQYQYWQFHLNQSQDSIWSVIDPIPYQNVEEDEFDGIAELTFSSEENCQIWIKAASILDSDQQNFVSKAILYVTNNGDSKTYVDAIENGEPIGGLEVVKFHCMVRKENTVNIEDFRKYMVNIFASQVVKNELVLKFRLHLLQEHDNSFPAAPNVSNYEPLEKQYQAAFEIAFKNRIDMENFLASKEYTTAVKDQTKYIKQITAFPERDTYTFVYNSKLTLAGQRTSTVAELITNLGATNQTQDNILNIILDKVAH